MALFTCDYQLKNVMGQLANPLDAFRNPLTSRIGSLQSVGSSLKSQLTSQLLNPVKPPDVTPEEWTARLAAMNTLSNTFTDVFIDPPGFASSKMSQIKSYTDFMSGQHGFGSPFPANVLSGSAAGAVGIGLVAGATFMTVMGVASGANTFNSQQCKPELEGIPNLPLPSACENSNSIFKTILGGYNSVLDSLNGVLGAVTGFLTQTAANLQLLQAAINDKITEIIAGIVAEITKLGELILEGLKEVLAKMLQGMALDPCAASILSMIAQPALALALNVNYDSATIPSTGLPRYL